MLILGSGSSSATMKRQLNQHYSHTQGEREGERGEGMRKRGKNGERVGKGEGGGRETDRQEDYPTSATHICSKCWLVLCVFSTLPLVSILFIGPSLLEK